MLPLRLLLAAAAFVAWLGTAHGATLDEARRLTDAFFAGQAEMLMEKMTPDRKSVV